MDEVILDILATPGASVSKVRGWHGAALKVAVRAAPERGKANAEVEEVLAEFFAVPRKNVSLVSGETSRNKRVRISGLSVVQVKERVDRLA